MTGMTLFSQFSFFLKRKVELEPVLGCLGSIPAPQNSASMKEKLTRVSGGTVLITQCAGPNRLPIVELGIKIGGNQQILLHIIRSPNETSYRWQKCRQTSCYMQPIHLLRMLVFLNSEIHVQCASIHWFYICQVYQLSLNKKKYICHFQSLNFVKISLKIHLTFFLKYD